MKKQIWLKITNPLLAVVFIVQVVTGIFHEQIGYETFEAIHPRFGFLLLIVVALHLFLNWSWIKAQYLKKKKS